MEQARSSTECDVFMYFPFDFIIHIFGHLSTQRMTFSREVVPELAIPGFDLSEVIARIPEMGVELFHPCSYG